MGLRIKLYLDQTPDRYILSPPLANLLKVSSDTMGNILKGIWHYAKIHKLHDLEDKKVLVCDEALFQVGTLFIIIGT